VDTFLPQHMPFRYRAPGLADACFLGELSHRPRPRLLISFEQIDYSEQDWMGFFGELVTIVNS
jgi:hypothetical protein